MTQTNKRTCCVSLRSEDVARLFKALCDPTRVTILADLAEGCEERTVSRVAECCPVDMSVVSRHLAMLKDAGAVQSVKRGKEVYYSVRAGDLVSKLRQIADQIEACCGSEEDEANG